jgi:ammonia channel protein AmtB
MFAITAIVIVSEATAERDKLSRIKIQESRIITIDTERKK